MKLLIIFEIFFIIKFIINFHITIINRIIFLSFLIKDFNINKLNSFQVQNEITIINYKYFHCLCIYLFLFKYII